MGFASLLAFICVLYGLHVHACPQTKTLETYIVHVEPAADLADASEGDLEAWYNSFLPRNLESNDVDQPRIIHSYRHVFTGFAAKLSAADVEAMKKKPGFVSARRERVLSPQTTHSPNFLGLSQNLGFWTASGYGKGVIIGVLDTGITPDHPSFNDEGMPPPPPKWKGRCQLPSRACNKKLIGARFFGCTYESPVDEEGHGTHTSSTAAGNFVRDASIFGNANGMAAGVAPHAHVAMYRVCDKSRACPESHIAAGMDAAIDDGVDILSLSIGKDAVPFYMDAIATGAYRATQKGILVSCAAGNKGPVGRSVTNGAPWILTVGASTTDRKLPAVAVLGNKVELDGQSAFQPMDSIPSTRALPLVFPRRSPYCDDITEDLRGKIVACEKGGKNKRTEKGKMVKEAGGAAMILFNGLDGGDTTNADAHVLPATHISYADGVKLKFYMLSTPWPTVKISYKGTVIGDKKAPVVASFSPRGPNDQSLGILKPDIIGPGVNVLAAWPVSVENKPEAKSTFSMASGTSMSCPHLSGVAALLKNLHPDWSPAAIKSAIMTTADPENLGGKPILDETLQPSNLFATGSGHVNPSRASDPGLVYDIEPNEYVPYLCGLKYTNQNISLIVQREVDCDRESSIPEAQLNYPSFCIVFGPPSQTYTRTVTNVGEAKSSYKVRIVPPIGANVKVEPAVLNFSQVNQKLSYRATFTRSPTIRIRGQGSITWVSAKHSVRSPISVIS